MDNRANLCAQHRKGLLFDIKRTVAQTSISWSYDRATRWYCVIVHKIHPLIAYERMSPVKLFINSALNIQLGPDYSQELHVTSTANGGEGIFESGFINSIIVFQARIVNWVELLEKVLNIADTFIMGNV